MKDQIRNSWKKLTASNWTFWDCTLSKCPTKFWFPAHNSGSVSIIVLSLLPLFFVGALTLLILVFSSEAGEKRNFSCQKAVLKAQRQAAIPIEQLLGLNSTVLGLRVALKAAEATLAYATITANAPLAAQATKEISSIKARQMQVASYQKFLIRTAKIQMYLAKTYYLTPTMNNELFPGETNVSQGFFSPAIEANDHAYSPPTYRLKDKFEDKQAIQLNWSARWTIGEFQWMKKWLGIESIRMRRSCAGTLTISATKKLEPRLIKAKSS